MDYSRVGGRVSAPPPSGKPQVAKGSLKNTGTDPPPSKRGPIASRGLSVRLSVKFVDDFLKMLTPPPPLPIIEQRHVISNNVVHVY